MRPTIYLPQAIARAILAEKATAQAAHGDARFHVRGARAAAARCRPMTRARVRVAAGVLALALAACGGDAAPATDSAIAVAVRLAPVERATVAEPVRATGTVSAKDEVALGFTSAGVVADVLVDEGDRIRAGQVLARLDLAQAEALHAKARSAAALAATELARAERLFRDSVVTRAQLDGARTASEVAAADLRAASFVRRTATIVAPASGVVLRRAAEPSAVVAAGQPVLVVRGEGSGVVLRAGLADRDAVRVRVGDRASVRLPAHPGEEYRGRVTQLGAGATAGTGTYEVEVMLEGGGRALASGLVGEVEIVPSRGEAVALVPVTAIVEGDADSAQVFSVAPGTGTARRHAVRVAWIRGTRVAVRAGLDGVQQVVTDGVAYVGDGTPVTVLAADSVTRTASRDAGRAP